MPSKKPTNIEEYKTWVKTDLDFEIDKRTELQFESAKYKISNDFRKSKFWEELTTQLNLFNQEYYLNTGFYLLTQNVPIVIYEKTFESFLLKTFRKNILNNTNWPEPPETGWTTPENWFESINDVIRTSIVTKYLDGVEFLALKISEISDTQNLKYKIDYEAKDEGYYAAHFYAYFPCNIPLETWESKNIVAPIEIQITTQLQEVIKKLLHTYYEGRRKEDESTRSKKWQWDYKSDEFSANYLGHILHYVEGMIMDVRIKQQKGNDDERS